MKITFPIFESLLEDSMAYWLWVCNSNIPTMSKYDFYNLKDKVLSRYGVKIGQDLQHIIKECRHCDGNGCSHCVKGIYSQSWIILDVYFWCGRIFHRPVRTVHLREQVPDIDYLSEIEGYVKHEHNDYEKSREYFMRLALLFDRKLFIRYAKYFGKPTGLVMAIAKAIVYPNKLKIDFLDWYNNRDYYRTINSTSKRQSKCYHMQVWSESEEDPQECPECGMLVCGKHREEYFDIPF